MMRFVPSTCTHKIYGNFVFIRYLDYRRHFSTRFGTAKSSKYTFYITGLGLTAIGSLCGSLYYCYYPRFFNPLDKILKINESIFNNSDNLFTLVIDSDKSSYFSSDVIDQIRSVLDCPELKHVKLCYAIKNENQNLESPIVIMYKGMRKKSLILNNVNSLDRDEIVKFFTPISEENPAQDSEFIPENVTLSNFKQQVINASTSEHPVLVQLFEDGCFLCFLMRPFVNSIHRILKAGNHKLSIKRLNIERNDFPPNCPISRATPTFILYKEGNADKWDEFKPHNLVDKLKQILALSNKEKKELDALVAKIPKRLQLIANMTQWYSQMLSLDHLGISTNLDYLNEDETHSMLLKDIMEQDMKLHDSLNENIVYLEKEIVSLERECILIAQDVAKELIDKFNY